MSPVHICSRFIFFLSVVGNFFPVLSIVSNIFCPLSVAGRLTPFTPSVFPFLWVENNKRFDATQDLTWVQAQFERFSYILSNGYRWNWALFVSPCPPECYYKAKRKLSLISGYTRSRGWGSLTSAWNLVSARHLENMKSTTDAVLQRWATIGFGCVLLHCARHSQFRLQDRN